MTPKPGVTRACSGPLHFPGRPVSATAERKAGGLMSGAASKAVHQTVRFAPMPAAIGTPKGLPLSSRGEGHAFCARRPRIASLPILPTLKGAKGPAPVRIACRGGSRTAPTSIIPIRTFHLATHGVPPAGNRATVKPLRVARVKPVAYLRSSYLRCPPFRICPARPK